MMKTCSSTQIIYTDRPNERHYVLEGMWREVFSLVKENLEKGGEFTIRSELTERPHHLSKDWVEVTLQIWMKPVEGKQSSIISQER